MTVCDITNTQFAILRLTTDQQAVRTTKQETNSTFWSLYMRFVHYTQWDKIQLEQKFSRALVGSRHHFGTFISIALLIQFTVGRLSIAYFSLCWNRYSGFISTRAAYLTPSMPYHLYNHKQLT